ncbi:MAG: hypothetical protein IKN54_03100 [Lachnospiraceae bacterium]|nr:hypothetical protein [Lachnospiraceae bacterium]
MRLTTKKAVILATALTLTVSSIAWAETVKDNKKNKQETVTEAVLQADKAQNSKKTEKITVTTPKLNVRRENGKGYIYWNKKDNNDKIEIWYSGHEHSDFVKKDVVSNERFKLSRFGTGSFYYVKIRAVRTVGGKKYKGKYSNVTPIVTGVNLVKVTSPAAGVINVRWEKAESAKGYKLEYSKDKDFKSVTTVYIEDKNKTSLKLYELVQNKRYYFRISAFKQMNSKDRKHSYRSLQKSAVVTSAAAIINGDFKDTNGFFKDSVFFGDSVLSGFGIYVNNKGRGYLDGTRVMGVISYSLISALKPTSDYHPLYKGKHVPPQNVAKALNAKKVFLFFGINDVLNTGNPQYCLDNYKSLISNITSKNPDVKIHIIRTTYSMKGSRDYVNYTANLHRFNQLLRDYCKKSDCEFIDVASYLTTSDGYLKPELCSDNFVHQTMNAYVIWDKVLRYYAWSQTKK